MKEKINSFAPMKKSTFVVSIVIDSVFSMPSSMAIWRHINTEREKKKPLFKIPWYCNTSLVSVIGFVSCLFIVQDRFFFVQRKCWIFFSLRPQPPLAHIYIIVPIKSEQLISRLFYIICCGINVTGTLEEKKTHDIKLKIIIISILFASHESCWCEHLIQVKIHKNSAII